MYIYTQDFRRHIGGFNPPSAQCFSQGLSEKLRRMLDAHGEQMAKDATEGSTELETNNMKWS